jgi:putative membrane protein
MRSGYRERHPFTGLIVGAISGLFGTVVMTQFQNIWNKISEDMQKPTSEHDAKPWEEQKEDSTMKFAGKISEEVGRPLSRDERKKAGAWVHYAFGTSVGAVFGLTTEMQPSSVRGINQVFVGAAYGNSCFPCCA